MIIGSDWIWLHFPKCGGTSAGDLLRRNFSADKSVEFGLQSPANIYWHANIPSRQSRDPKFRAEGKRVVAIFRRLPDWILSRVHYELSEPPHNMATREMLLKGEFHERNGVVNTCETIFQYYNTPAVDYWVRLENLHQDFERFFNRRLTPNEKVLNVNKFNYVRDSRFWFTKSELRGLYDNNPSWAAAEQKVYGNLLGE